jgi:methionyl-tRNA formyltransferase
VSRLRVAFMGTPEFAVPTLRGLLDAGHEVVLVLSQPDRPAGRGRQPAAPPVARRRASGACPCSSRRA